MSDESLLGRGRNNPLFKSFLFYSAFRAVYGLGILFIAYFFATATVPPSKEISCEILFIKKDTWLYLLL